jgi:heat shock protein HslJ
LRSPALNVLLFAGLTVGMAATAAESPAQETAGEGAVPAELVGTEWRLVEIDGRAPDSDLPPVTLSFALARAEGSGGCNWYTGWLEQGAAGRFVVSHLAVTRRDCAHPRIMDREEGYLAALEEVSSYRLIDGELALTSRTTEGETRLVFTPD